MREIGVRFRLFVFSFQTFSPARKPPAAKGQNDRQDAANGRVKAVALEVVRNAQEEGLDDANERQDDAAPCEVFHDFLSESANCRANSQVKELALLLS